MLYLLFQIREDWYALDVMHVAEVLPLVKFKPILHAPPGLAGVFNYHGAPVPLVDLSGLLVGTSTSARMSTRVVLINFPTESGAKVHVGLIVEEVMETLRRTEADFADSRAAVTTSPYLGRVTMDGGRIIHQIDLRGLLSGALCEHLFPQPTVSV